MASRNHQVFLPVVSTVVVSGGGEEAGVAIDQLVWKDRR